jgi:hypothetical protein
MPPRIWLSGNIPDPATAPRRHHFDASKAIAGERDVVERTTTELRAALAAAIADAEEVEHLAKVFGTRSTAAAETGQVNIENAPAATACDIQAIDTAEAINCQLLPQQDTWTRDASTNEMNAGAEQYADHARLETVDDAPGASCLAENGVATHIILELHDRLGSFIKR